MTAESWTSWEEQQPPSGMCWWRVESSVITGMMLIFTAQLETCNGIATPPFYYWSKGKIVIPPCDWKYAPGIDSPTIQRLSIEGLEFLPCPFCGDVPILRGCQYIDGGLVIGARPQNYNCWGLKCCEWCSKLLYKDPHDIEQIRREAFARVSKYTVL